MSSSSSSSSSPGGSMDQMRVTTVDVACVPGTEAAFAAASIANARSSVEEEDNARFDVLQDVGDDAKFVLVEIYDSPEGVAAHKETAHYARWRDDVADAMAVPRRAGKYVPVYPWRGLWGSGAAARRKASARSTPEEASFLKPRRDDGASDENEDENGPDENASSPPPPSLESMHIAHVHVHVKPGMEDEFVDACVANAASSVLEPDNLRFDVLRSEEDPTRFVLIEIYATAEGPAAHKKTPHYAEWRTTVEDMMASPRSARTFRPVFPTEVDEWKMALWA